MRNSVFKSLSNNGKQPGYDDVYDDADANFMMVRLVTMLSILIKACFRRKAQQGKRQIQNERKSGQREQSDRKIIR